MLARLRLRRFDDSEFDVAHERFRTKMTTPKCT
jgi:hypothetical protein